MNTLISIRTNILYGKDKKDPSKFNKHHELVFIVDKPGYKISNEGDVIRERELEEFRIVVSEKSFESMISILKKLKDADESELS